MRKMFVSLMVAGIVSLAVTWPAAAQSSAAEVKIPFQFIVGNKVMPAGRYLVSTQTTDWAVVLITSLDGNAVAAFTSTQAVPHSARDGSDAHVTFRKYFGQYFFQGVAVPGWDAREVNVTKEQAERTLAKLNLLSADRADSAK